MSEDEFVSHSLALSTYTDLKAFDIATFTGSEGETLILLSFTKQEAPDLNQFFVTLEASTLAVIDYVRYDNYPSAADGKGRFILSSPGQDFFYTVRNTNGFAFEDGTQTEILIDKRSLLYSQDNRYSCQVNNALESTELVLTSVTLTAADVDLDTEVYTLGDFDLRIAFMINPYVQSQIMSKSELTGRDHEANTISKLKLYP